MKHVKLFEQFLDACKDALDESVNEAKNSFKFNGGIDQLEDMLSNDDHHIEGGDEDEDTYYIVDRDKSTVGVIHWDGKIVTLLDVPKGVFVNESVNEGYVNEGYSGNFPKDITLAKTKKVAEEVAKAMNMIAEPGEEYKVNTRTIDNASFDLDVVRNGMVDEYDGGSYNLYDDGSIVNMATWDRKTGESPVFGDWRRDNAKKIANNVKKMMNESLTEAAIKWQDAKEGDSALVKDLNKLGLIVKAYGRKFHLKFPDGSDKTYDASELEFVTNEAVSEAKSEAELVKKANQFKKELMQLKKDPKGNELRIAAKEEQLSRVAQAIRNVRADKMGEAVTEAKDLRSLQKALDRLQNDYEAVLDDETLDAMSELITTVNSKL